MNNFMEHWFWPIIMLLSILSAFFISYLFLKRKQKQQEEQNILTKNINFVTNKSKLSEDDFVDYVKLAAGKEKIAKDDIRSFYLSRHEGLRLGYVMETRRFLLINNIDKFLKKLG